MPTPDEFLLDVNKTYKEDLVLGKDKTIALQRKRFSTGIFSLDLITGGGWVFGANQLIAGPESSGKTYKAIKAMQSVAQYCKCRKPLRLCDCGKKEPCQSMFVDVEGAFDPDWAQTCGVNLDLMYYVRPQYGEQASDIVNKAIAENVFDLIIVDSYDAMIPIKTVESSIEDGQRMGARAALIGDSVRKWLNSRVGLPGGGAALIGINQLRLKPGVMYGDPRYMSGGEAQKYYHDIIVWLKAGKIEDDPTLGESARALLGGQTKKNKTAPPGKEFAYNLALIQTELYKKGDPYNYDALFDFGKKYELIKKESGNWDFAGKVKAKNEEEFLKMLKATGHDLLLWRSILKHVTGYENL